MMLWMRQSMPFWPGAEEFKKCIPPTASLILGSSPEIYTDMLLEFIAHTRDYASRIFAGLSRGDPITLAFHEPKTEELIRKFASTSFRTGTEQPLGHSDEPLCGYWRSLSSTCVLDDSGEQVTR